MPILQENTAVRDLKKRIKNLPSDWQEVLEMVYLVSVDSPSLYSVGTESICVFCASVSVERLRKEGLVS